tara:strand:- start:903 stop:1193 length:291 start_codon:yes stop_codon:yes gene_type:complete
MAHIRDFKVAKLLMQKASEFFVHEAGMPVSVVDAKMLDKRTLHVFYKLPPEHCTSPESMERQHQVLLTQLPKLRHYIARNTSLRALPTIHLKLTLD